jgi:hypothetical protein
MSFTFCNAVQKGPRLPLTYHSELIVCTKTNASYLFLIDTAPVTIVHSIDISSQKELSFIGKEHKFRVKETIMYCQQKPVIKIQLSG